MNDVTAKWIEAAKVLGRDPSAKVPCPVCDFASLEVREVPNPANEAEFERYLQCPSCGAVNIMRMRKEPGR
jgi:uncharacterized C2H2 Zn-finger protein